ncbi:MAG: DNA polymerase III subunit beta [Firmicutes bacterium]|nr:DNA polymerase III subunit beta [Bacillota bacterium]
MKFECPRDLFYQGLQVVGKAVPSKSTLPILSGILLEAKDDRLRLVATDLELGIESFLPVNIQEEGSVVLEAKYLTDIVRKLPSQGISVGEVSGKNSVEIKSGRSRFVVNPMSAEDFPSLPETRADGYWSIPQNVLRKMIKETSFAVSLDETRPFLTGVLWDAQKTTLSLVATDTSRLAYSSRTLEEDLGEQKVIIPTKCLTEVSRVLESTDDEIQVLLSGNHILFKVGETRFISRLIDGQFPNYRQVIPTSFITEAQVNRSSFLSAVERASLLAKEGSSVVKFNIEPEKLSLSANVPDVGETYDEVSISASGERLEIAFNARYIIEVLRILDTDSVILKLTGKHSPAVIHPENDENYTYVVMPVMLR